MARRLYLNPLGYCVSGHVRLALLATMVAMTSPSWAAEQGEGCLYGIFVGERRTPVTGCPESDPLGVGQNQRVNEAMRILEVPKDLLIFRGCPGAAFAAIEHKSSTKGRQIIVTYPTEERETYLAPIIHEIAHAMQISHAHGLDKLRAAQSSIQIELSADFMVGYVFAKALKDLQRKEFQHNLSLVGSYVDRREDAHGRPDQRSDAFRFGAVSAYPYSILSAVEALNYFNENDFSRIAKKQ